MPLPVNLSELSNIVKQDVVKKAVYDQLVQKVNNIGTRGFVLKTKNDADKTELENAIPDTSGLVKKIDYNAKITEIENKIPNIKSLVKKKIITQKLLKLKRN